ncbi:hypothetical protein [Accumulibacter sp.]|uniref:hypothetical protein n=1 Tax=Accumulibacter sp. TaxID=2053492 RepID=UPI0026135D7C|nr:hypothetical protein [Accumulibacter sp.]
MIDEIALPGETPISIDAGHGHEPLHGLLSLPARPSALIVLSHAGRTPEKRDEMLAMALRHAGVGALTIDLLTPAEERFADNHHNVPLLARRLLDALALIKRQMRDEQLPALPIGLCAAGDCSPVVLRVAALRDHDIFAIVCRGGLIDLAGMLYLRSLASPLLVLVNADDENVVASNRRALRELSGRKELKRLPGSVGAPDSAAAGEWVAGEAAHWFLRHLPAATAIAPDRA